MQAAVDRDRAITEAMPVLVALLDDLEELVGLVDRLAALLEESRPTVAPRARPPWPWQRTPRSTELPPAEPPA